VLRRRRAIVDADPMSEEIEDYLAEINDEVDPGDPDDGSYDDDEHQFEDDDAEPVTLPDYRRTKPDDESNDWETWSQNSDEPTEEFNDDDDGFVFDDDDEESEED